MYIWIEQAKEGQAAMKEIGNRPLTELMRLMPGILRRAVENAGTDLLEEIRIREGRPVQLLYSDKEKMLTGLIEEGLCARTLEALSEHALFVREKELEEGFLTVRGGCRVGVAGHYVPNNAKSRFAEATSCNIRIAREHKGVADNLMSYLIRGSGRPKSVLILSAPGRGKTTILRDAARQLSDGSKIYRGLKVAIADERCELAGGSGNTPVLDVGQRTDVMDGCKKAEAMERLIRSMSPDVIVTDELGNMEDAQAALYASACGIALVASAHAGSMEEAMRKPYLQLLIGNGCFQEVLFLQRFGNRLVLNSVKRDAVHV